MESGCLYAVPSVLPPLSSHHLHTDLLEMLSTEGTVQAQGAPRGPYLFAGQAISRAQALTVPLGTRGNRGDGQEGEAAFPRCPRPTLCSRAWSPFSGLPPYLQCGQVCDLVSQGPNPVIAPVYFQPRLQLNQLLIPASVVPRSRKGDLGLPLM